MIAITRDGITYPLALADEPTCSLIDGSGYGSASIPCSVPDIDLRGAIVRVDLADPWYGIIIDNPRQGDPLQVAGYGVVGTYQRREALYCDTAISPWVERTLENRNPNMSCDPTPFRLRIRFEGGTSLGTRSNGFWRRLPETTSGLLTFSWSRPSTNVRITVIYGIWTDNDNGDETVAPDEWSVTVANSGSGSLTGTASVTMDSGAFNCVLIRVDCPSGYTPGSDTAVWFSLVRLYGVAGVTSTTGINVVTDILEQEIDPYYLPADRYDWLAEDSTVVRPLVYEPGTANSKLETLQTLTGYRYGWYTERVGASLLPCPRWEAAASAPIYRIDVDEASESSLDSGSLEPLASAVDVVWADSGGQTQVTRVYDSDPTHRLVQLGMTTDTTAKVAEVQADTESATTAEAIGTLAAAEYGRDQLRGDITVPVRTLAGVVVPGSRVRPNRMALVYGMSRRPLLAMVRESESTGDSICRVTLDNTPYRLDAALARLSNRANR